MILCADCVPHYCPTHNTDCSFRAHNSNCNEHLQCCVYFHQLSAPTEIPKSISHTLQKESCIKYNCKVYYKQHVKAIQLCCSFHHLKHQNNCIHNFSLQGFYFKILGYYCKIRCYWGLEWCSWFRHYATSRKVMSQCPMLSLEFFIDLKIRLATLWPWGQFFL